MVYCFAIHVINGSFEVERFNVSNRTVFSSVCPSLRGEHLFVFRAEKGQRRPENGRVTKTNAVILSRKFRPLLHSHPMYLQEPNLCHEACNEIRKKFTVVA